MSEKIIQSFTYYELEKRRPSFAILPIGSFEQHGHHLPMTTDTLIAGIVAKYIGDEYDGLVLPPIPISCSQEHNGFFGSLWISASTLSHIVRDIVEALNFNGIRALVIVNGHGGNYVLGNIVQEINLSGPTIMLLPTKYHWQAAFKAAGIEKTPSEDMHAGEFETSVLMHEFPETLRKEQIADHDAPLRPWLQVHGMKEYTDTGTIGFPSLASASKGELVLKEVTRLVGPDIKRFLEEV
ncbi:MAG: creatininase family protein [Symploca sp. SIO1A3]|nr:creatininase family protein [Symploca sp. SIO1A3]